LSIKVRSSNLTASLSLQKITRKMLRMRKLRRHQMKHKRIATRQNRS